MFFFLVVWDWGISASNALSDFCFSGELLGESYPKFIDSPQKECQ